MASYYSGTKLSPEQVAGMLSSAGVRGDDLWKLVGIAGRESGYDVGAHRTDQPREKLSGDLGLFQVNYSNVDKLRQAGVINSREDLLNPAKNVQAAVWLYRQGGLNPWAMGANGWQSGGDPLKGVKTKAAQEAVQRFQMNPEAYSGGQRPTASALAERGTTEMPARNTDYDPTYTPPKENPQAQRSLTTLLSTLGVDYPDAPRASPQLLTFLRGVQSSSDLAEDLYDNTVGRLDERRTDSMSDLARTVQRRRRSITNDSVSRNALVSGATNRDFAEQQENLAASTADIERAYAESRGQANDLLLGSRDSMRQQAMERTLGEETRQATEEATAKEQERAFKAAQAESDYQFQRSQAARDRQTQATIDAYGRYGV